MMWPKALRIMLAGLLVLAAGACGGDDSETPPESTTDAGTEEGGACTIGTQGCSCAEGNRCAPNQRGEALLCKGGICENATCMSGDRGCVCRAGTTCANAKDVCKDGFCQATGCLPGQANCQCLASTCDPGLHCLNSSLCVDGKGYEGGACLDNGRCNRGTAAISAGPLRALRSRNCGVPVQRRGHVRQRSRLRGRPVHRFRGRPAVVKPECYTPCEANLNTANDQRACDSDKLMSGCLDAQECAKGSCVDKGKLEAHLCDGHRLPVLPALHAGGMLFQLQGEHRLPSGSFFPTRRSAGPPVRPRAAPLAAGQYCEHPDVGQNGYCVQLLAEGAAAESAAQPHVLALVPVCSSRA